ncbi:MAG: hypothetical protein WAV41_02670 [Microgenomates group bacterium]
MNIGHKNQFLEGVGMNSRLGTLLTISATRVRRREPELKGVDLKVRAIEELAVMAKCNIDPDELLATGGEYFVKGKGKRVVHVLNNYYDELAARVK